MPHTIQGSPEWLKWRRERIGASDAPIIMDSSPWTTPYQLWQKKLGYVPDQVKNDAMQRGHDLEPIARAKYIELTGIDVQPAVKQHPAIPYMIASLDGVNFLYTKAVEIKCPGKADHEMAMSGKVPEKYYAQLQHQIEVLGLDVIHYFSFNPISCKLIEINRDQPYIDKLLIEAAKFYECMQKKEPPPLVDRDYTVMGDEEWLRAASGLLLAKKLRQQYEEKEVAARKELIALARQRNCCGGGIKMSKSIRRGSIDYSLINEIKEIDLEQYRKPSSEVWRIDEV